MGVRFVPVEHLPPSVGARPGVRDLRQGKPMIEPSWSTDRIAAHLRQLPIWQGPIEIQPMIGGLCNKSFRITDGDARTVARIGSDILVHGITQTSVQTAMHAASDIGVTPHMRYGEPGLAVVDFLDGGCLRPEDIEGNEPNLVKIVDCLKRLHGGADRIRGPLTYFWPFQVVRHYAQVGLEKGSRLAAELPEMIRIATVLEAAIEPYTPVFTHNDVVPQNMMFDAEGGVWLIDWDYGGYGHPLFDVAGVGANADASEATERRIVELYFGRVDDALWRQFTAFKLILNLREYMWGMVQEVASELDEEVVAAAMAELYPGEDQGYEGYTNLNRTRFEANWQAHRSVFEG
jgi:thiamine kinase-like enzyme